MVGATLLALISVPSLYYLRVKRRANKLSENGKMILPLERAAE
jgi:hypothetical protein